MIKEALVTVALALGQTPSVLDGDTVKLSGVSIRLVDYDAPEYFHPRCPREYMRARAAKMELERLISQVKLELVPCATKNWGRLCARGTIDGEPLSDHMIKAELAVFYPCGPKSCPRRVDWCSHPDPFCKIAPDVPCMTITPSAGSR
jgi:micrococcal nuclease